jgi:hypothetical protein
MERRARVRRSVPRLSRCRRRAGVDGVVPLDQLVNKGFDGEVDVALELHLLSALDLAVFLDGSKLSSGARGGVGIFVPLTRLAAARCPGRGGAPGRVGFCPIALAASFRRAPAAPTPMIVPMVLRSLPQPARCR